MVRVPLPSRHRVARQLQFREDAGRLILKFVYFLKKACKHMEFSLYMFPYKQISMKFGVFASRGLLLPPIRRDNPMQDKTMLDVAVFLFRTEKRNCAEAVAGAWQKVTGKNLAVTENLSECGFGSAPQGLCGAVYAAQLVSDEGKKGELADRFADAAGSLLCGEIRSMRKLSCTGCVKLAATLLEENLQKEVA
jgi:hypothetical protein